MKNLKIGSGLKKGVAFALVFFNVFIGSHITGIFDKSAKAEGYECSDVELTFEYKVNDERIEAFKKILNSESGEYFTDGEFDYAVSVLNQCMMSSEFAARIKMLNGKEITVEDFDNFSKYCDNENDKKVIDELFEKMAEVYNISFGNRKKMTYTEFVDFINEFAKWIEENKTAVRKGSMWALKASGYNFAVEYSSLFVEQNIPDPETAKKVTPFTKILWTYMDREKYLAMRVFELKEGLDLNETINVLNAMKCQSPEVEVIVTFLEMVKRLKEANREMYDCSTKGFAIYDTENEVIKVFQKANSQEGVGKGA